jgi:phosphoribosylformylglycinamidine cyclo-ligase
VPSLLPLIQTQDGIHGLAHITGGGLIENVPRILPKHLEAVLTPGSWFCPPIFKWISDSGPVSTPEVLRTFNCGIGFVIVCDESAEDNIRNVLKGAGETVTKIGYLRDKITEQGNVQLENPEDLFVNPFET